MKKNAIHIKNQREFVRAYATGKIIESQQRKAAFIKEMTSVVKDKKILIKGDIQNICI